MQKPSLEDGFLYLTLAAEDAAWNASHAGTKSVELTSNEVRNNYQYTCSYSEVEGEYGIVSVDNDLVATHMPAVTDASDILDIVGGDLVVTQSPRSGAADYYLENGVLMANDGFTGSITAVADFNPEAQYKVINFYYDHNGLRTRKLVWDHGVTETYDYTLHGKLITHMTKRTVDEEGNESSQELHFFYDSQSKPAFVEFEGERFRYVHSLQGDIIAIVDAAGNTVVEYKYDAWGKLVYNTAGELAFINPFGYRAYVWDAETNDACLESRYYSLNWNRFINCDKLLGKKMIIRHNVFTYCGNNPVMYSDPHGYSFISLLEQFKSKLESGIPFILNTALYYLGKRYSIEQPKSGVVIRSKPKTIATGSSQKYTIDGDQLLRNLGTVVIEEYYKVWDKAHTVYKLTVNIIQYGDAEPVANVTLHEGKNERQSVGDASYLQDVFSQSYSVIERTDSNYVLFSGGNYYETTEAGTALIDELFAKITLTE